MVPFLKIGGRLINLSQVTDIELHGHKTLATSIKSCVRISMAVTEGSPEEVYGRYFEFFDDEAEAIREFFAPGIPCRGLFTAVDLTPVVATEDMPL